MADHDFDAAVAGWPELAAEQRDQLAVLLRPGSRGVRIPESRETATDG